MSGYPYNQPEPKEACPYCGTLTWADFADVGIGFTQCGPYHCDSCEAYQIGPYDKPKELSEEEQRTGWYAPKSSKEFTSGNVLDGKFTSHQLALKAYRASYGLPEKVNKQVYLTPVHNPNYDGPRE